MRALVLVDLQNDFAPGGALPVPRAHEVMPVVRRLARRFPVVVATQDWHPQGHGSFASAHGRPEGEVIDLHGLPQVLWPDHCVQGSAGADFLPGFPAGRVERVFRKGDDPAVDSYSGFHDNGRRRSTGLAEWLRARGVDEVFVCGLATDYCVRATALDAVREGFRTTLVEDACRGVDRHSGDVSRALDEMRSAGVVVVGSEPTAAG